MTEKNGACLHVVIQLHGRLGKWRCIACGKIATAQYFETSTQKDKT